MRTFSEIFEAAKDEAWFLEDFLTDDEAVECVRVDEGNYADATIAFNVFAYQGAYHKVTWPIEDDGPSTHSVVVPQSVQRTEWVSA